MKKQPSPKDRAWSCAMGYGMAFTARAALENIVHQGPIQSLTLPEELEKLREAVQILNTVLERANVEFHDALT